MSRTGLLILLVWAVIAAPALCVAGVLEHACPCEEESACDHELDCESDPCSDLVFRKDESGSSLDTLLPPALLPAVPAWVMPAPGGPGSWIRTDRIARPPGVPHRSDLPLLN